MDSQELRQKFIKFFVDKGHKELPPSSLIPENDPSVLFTTAGMQQFKRYYTNPEEAPAKNVVTCQPCLRTSDIEEVGDDTHLTFFEMLGNFSFGGYFKKEAIEWGYEFLTKELRMNPERLMCSIFAGDEKNPRDDESAKILEAMNLKYEEHGRVDNFWGPTGNEGPCGPTVEFYVDGIEVWNLVFNEYFKDADGTYRKLETPGVDTGMGLERMLVVLNGFKDIYNTDLLSPIIAKIDELLPLEKAIDQEYMRIMADHMRSGIMLIREGIEPGKSKRESVLRRLIRSMVQHSNFKEYGDWVGPIAKEAIEALAKNKNYSDLKEKEENIITIIQEEVDKFRDILILAEKNLGNKREFSEEDAANLHQSAGVPFYLYNEYSIMRTGKKLSYDKFLEFERKHQELSRTASAGMFKGGLVGQSDITTRMHTATHLLLKALQEVLGPEVHQRGSNINEERIRFDFSYPKPMTPDEIKKVEDIINEKIKEDLPVIKKETTVEEAKALGAEAQFIEKYSQYGKLTMYSIGDYSHELCGGPHVESTGEIGKFKILKEESSSSGVRRIRAIIE